MNDRLPIHFAYLGGCGNLAVMEPDRRNLLQNLDEPPATCGGLAAGVAILFVLLALLTSWDAILALLQL